jgi:hypothetical protein
MQPGQEELGFVAELGLKIAGVFLSFVGGIVTATWVVANKLRGYDDRLKTIEEAHVKCQNVTLAKIDQKLDRIHERIDDILIERGRHEPRA